MYIYSPNLKERIAEISAIVKNKTNGKVIYEEFIAIPYYGNIILRFTLEDEDFTVNDLDIYESIIYDIVKDEFLVDFMGSVYKKVGVDFSKQESQYAKLAELYKDEVIEISIHAEEIRKDAKELLKIAGINNDMNVWEIQVDEDSLVLLILGETNKKIKEISEPINLYVGEVNKISCMGLIKAAIFAKKEHISLARILLES